MSKKLIYGVSVNFDSEDVKSVKTEEDVKNLDLFEHLNDEHREASYKRVLQLVKEGSQETKKELPVDEFAEEEKLKASEKKPEEDKKPVVMKPENTVLPVKNDPLKP